MPGDKDDSEDRPLYDESKDANNPENYNKFNFEDEEVVRV